MAWRGLRPVYVWSAAGTTSARLRSCGEHEYSMDEAQPLNGRPRSRDIVVKFRASVVVRVYFCGFRARHRGLILSRNLIDVFERPEGVRDPSQNNLSLSASLICWIVASRISL